MDRDWLYKQLDEDEELTDQERREYYQDAIDQEREEEDRYYNGF